MTQKLFMVYLGGSAQGANIELHDIRFVVAATIEQAYPLLKRQWLGDRKSVHMDSYLHLHHVDGYRVELSEQPVARSRRLYFVNFGGYFPGQMAEFHEFTLVVADSPAEAKELARAKVINAGLAGAEQLHKDDLLAVDDCLTLDLIDGYHIELRRDGESQPLEPDWMGYQPLP